MRVWVSTELLWKQASQRLLLYPLGSLRAAPGTDRAAQRPGAQSVWHPFSPGSQAG